MTQVLKTQMLPAVTIVTPIFNAEKYIAETIESILRQSFEGWELILVDDCSEDASEYIAKSFVASDPRIKLISLEENSGAAVARNAGITAASGRYIAFLDSDDQWTKDKLEKQLDFMRKNECALSYTWYECVDEFGGKIGKVYKPPSELTYAELLRSNQIGCLTAMYDTAKLGKILMPLIRKRQDYGLWLRILKRVDKAYCLPEVLAYYRQRAGSISSNKLEMLKYNWALYRDVENLTLPKSAYYLGWNILRKVIG